MHKSWYIPYFTVCHLLHQTYLPNMRFIFHCRLSSQLAKISNLFTHVTRYIFFFLFFSLLLLFMSEIWKSGNNPYRIAHPIQINYHTIRLSVNEHMCVRESKYKRRIHYCLEAFGDCLHDSCRVVFSHI